MVAGVEGAAWAGRYRILEEIGRGRRAVVLVAEDSVLGRRVAVKRAHSPAETPLMLEEARRLARVDSPHVVSLHDVLMGPPVTLVLELLEGESVRARLRERGRFDVAAVAPLVRDLLAGLRSVHAARLVHGDVKPENLWIATDGRLVLLDLGAPGDGTAMYGAPEVGPGEAATFSADLYSAAIVAYEMLCGRPPFDAAAAEELTTRKRSQRAATAQQAGATLAPEIEAWLARSLDARPERRFTDAESAWQAWCEATRLDAPALRPVAGPGTLLHSESWTEAIALLETATRGHGARLFLAGERGLGKSVLSRRWCEVAIERGGIALAVRMRPSLRRTPFAAWRAAVRAAIPQLGVAAGSLVPRPGIGAANEIAQQERIVRGLSRLTKRSPVMIAVDGVEQCDGATRRLVLRLARDARRLRIAMLATTDSTAPGQVATATREALAALGPLHELSLPDEETWRRYVANTLGVADLSDALVAHVRQRSGGNPLFARLLLAELRTGGALRRSGDGWVFRPELASGAVPRGAAGLFERRLRGLDAAGLRLLQLAALQGARFDANLLARHAGRDALELHDALQMLSVRHALVRRDGEEYIFQPPLLAAHLIAGLAPERRRAEHAALATAHLESAAPNDAAVGVHLFWAGLGTAALPYLERAGRAALERHDAEAAAASLELACRACDAGLASEEEVARRLDLGLLRIGALRRLAAWETAAEELAGLLVLARAWGQDAAEVRALRAQGEIEYGRTRYDEAIARYLEAQACAARSGDEQQMHELALQVGNIHFERGELELAAVEYERVLDYATRSGDLELEARAANNVALVESIQGRKDRAVQFFNRSLERFRALGRADAVARLHQNIGQIYFEVGNWAEARNFFQRSMEESEASNQPGLLAVACLDCAEANIRLGARAEAAVAIERALAICRECGDEIGIANAHRLQASLAAAAGDAAAAEARLLESIETLQRLGQALQLGLCWKDLGAVRLQAGRLEPAAAALAAARQVFAALDAPQHAAEVDALLARCKAVAA